MKKVKLIIVYPDGSFKQEEVTLGGVLRLLTNGFFSGKRIDCIIIDPINEGNPEFELPNKKAT